jgi:polar amino acid transport system substrate-binding protein
MKTPRSFISLAVALLSAGAIVGCGSSSSSSSAGSSSSSASSSSTSSSATSSGANAAAASLVPTAIKSKGTITVASDATYAPNEFIGPDGHTVIGMDADLSQALAAVMGLKANVVNVTFDAIIPGLSAGKYDLGASSFTDTIARQRVVDFVDYFTAGEGFYVKSGSPLAFNGLTSLCGHSVAVESGTVEQTDAQAQAKTCTKNNKAAVTVLTFGNQSQGNLAVSSGRADVGFADSQVAGYIVATSNGVFQNSGTAFSVAPYGLALPKGNGMAAPVQQAVNLLIGNGVYAQILAKWGVQSGAVTSSLVNGATS